MYGLFYSFSSPWWANLYLPCHILWPNARSSGDIYILLVTYSVHKKLFDVIFCTHTTQYWPIFYLISTRTCTSGDLFCTHPSSWWYTLYWGNVLMVYFVHIAPHVDINSISTSSSYLVCTLGNFTVYFVYLPLDELNFLWVTFYGIHVYVAYFERYFKTTWPYSRWPNLYTYLLLVTYSVHK